ncbi:uncharacterized protein LOC141913301 [Tubulanus polymorphus]|uniref:uncharacterized protein LOC141913301 n=1 Tax=Tubulanus polymorphus TaxID=672921 RepID=UPI003DA53E66
MDRTSIDSESSAWRSRDGMDALIAANGSVPSIRKNVLVNSISMKLRGDPQDARMKHRDTEKDKVRLDILERQLFKAGIRPDRSLFKWDNPAKCQQKNLFRSTNLNKRNFQRMRGHRNAIAGDVSNTNISEVSSTSFSSSEDSGGYKKKRAPKSFTKIELEDWEISDGVKTVKSASTSRLTQGGQSKSKHPKSSSTKQTGETCVAADINATSASKTGDAIDEDLCYDEPYIGPKKAKAPKVPFDHYSIRPLYNRAKTSILPGAETTDPGMGYKWALSTNQDNFSHLRKSWPNRSYGSVMKNVHPVATALDREGTSVEKLRFRVLNKPGDFHVAKVWPRQDIDTIIQPNLWAKEASKLMMFRTY